MALYIVYKLEGGQMISAVNNQVLPKLHLGSERADLGSERADLGSERADLGSERAEIREVLNKVKQSLRFQVRNPLAHQTSC